MTPTPVRFGSPLQRLLLSYTRTFLAVISQSVACSQHHSVEQRLARWLLTMDDYAGSREFRMDHLGSGPPVAESLAGRLPPRPQGHCYVLRVYPRVRAASQRLR